MIRTGDPAEFAGLVDRLLAKNPADRPADAVAVRDGLLPLAGRAEDSAPQLPHWSALDSTGPLHKDGVEAPTRPAAVPESAPQSVPVSATGGAGMDVFGVHRTLIEDYRLFTEGGTVIRGERIEAVVEEEGEATRRLFQAEVSNVSISQRATPLLSILASLVINGRPRLSARATYCAS